MKKIITTSLITFTITALLFTSGIFVYFYIKNELRGNHSVLGIVKYQEKNTEASADHPEGYYIESSAIDKIYLEHENMAKYLDKHVTARGYLKEICGNDRGACFPLIKVGGISVLEN